MVSAVHKIYFIMKKTFKGTKGNWELESENPTVFPSVVLQNETKFLSIAVHLNSIERVKNNYKDGTYDYSDKGSISLLEENMANAKLIASAPEMLEVLEALHNLLCEHEPDWYMKYHYNIAKKVLDKVLT
jgi:hypothetical protein